MCRIWPWPYDYVVNAEYRLFEFDVYCVKYMAFNGQCLFIVAEKYYLQRIYIIPCFKRVYSRFVRSCAYECPSKNYTDELQCFAGGCICYSSAYTSRLTVYA